MALLVSGGSDYGILTLQSTAGLEFPYPDSVNNSPSITFYADNPAEANAALEGLIFTPAANYNGPIHLDIMVQDTTNQYDYVSTYGPITVSPVGDAPVAGDDAYELSEDYPLSASMGVLFNDLNVDGGPLQASLVSGPAHGAVTLNANGTFTYTPAANYNGPDSFVDRATNAGGLSDEATVSLTIQPMFDPIRVNVPGPQATLEDTPLTFSAAGGNAITITDIDGGRVEVSMSASGTLSLQNTEGLEFPEPNTPNNSPWIIFRADSAAAATAALEGMVFTPFPDMPFDVMLSMLVRDLEAPLFSGDTFAEVPITVTPVNDAPVATPDGPYTVEAGEALTVNTGTGGYPGRGVLVNDSDVDYDLLSAVLETGPSHGTLTLNANGTFTYTADPTYSGTDTFTYRASDGQLTSDPATVTINVTPRNWPPVTAADAYSVNEDAVLTVTAASSVLANDHDPEGLPITAQLVTGPSHGTLTFNANGSFTYTPAANYNGPDEFWYRAFDGVRYSAAARVALTVNPVNDAPVAAADTYTLDEDTPLNVPPAGVLGNDSDLDGDALSASVVSGPSHGTLTLNPNGSFTYSPVANYNGPDSFTYRAADPSDAGSVATVSLTVRSVNDAPVAVDDVYSTSEEAPLSVIVAGSNSLTMTSDTGDYIGCGQNWNYGSGATYSLYNPYPSNPTYTNAVAMSVTSGSDWWYLDFWAPNNARFVPGMTYTGATRFPFNSSSQPGMDISGNGRGSNTLTGWFRVSRVAYGPSGEVLVFVTFGQPRRGDPAPWRGAVQRRATAPGGVLLNDSDAEGSPLTATLVTGTARRQVFCPNGTFMYLPTETSPGRIRSSTESEDGARRSTSPPPRSRSPV